MIREQKFLLLNTDFLLSLIGENALQKKKIVKMSSKNENQKSYNVEYLPFTCRLLKHIFYNMYE